MPVVPIRPRSFCYLSLSVSIQALVPAVDYVSPRQSHASITPVGAYPVSGFPIDWSQPYLQKLVLPTSLAFDALFKVRLCSSLLSHTSPQFDPGLFSVAHYQGF